MAVSVQTFTQFVQNQVAAIQGTCAALIDFTVGSVLRAFIEANAAQGLFLEAQALQVAALTRASTSTGTDLDTFFADFGFFRLAASQAKGQLPSRGSHRPRPLTCRSAPRPRASTARRSSLCWPTRHRGATR